MHMPGGENARRDRATGATVPDRSDLARSMIMVLAVKCRSRSG